MRRKGVLAELLGLVRGVSNPSLLNQDIAENRLVPSARWAGSRHDPLYVVFDHAWAERMVKLSRNPSPVGPPRTFPSSLFEQSCDFNRLL